ncbi:VOC family protein [Rhodoplanes azumiensis]|uniref:VOC family protein n=1 Tax=Rhodoplanes azumiensis TaxID=1897628 RepID=A0ABW5AP91_9BRAD
MEECARQLPAGEQIFLDHVGHFAADRVAAGAALAQAGFAPTPPSVQVNPAPDGTATPTGTGNVTAMFSRGYVEVLFKTADTPLGRQLDTARERYPGVHLIAFAVADAAAHHERVAQAGMPMQPLVSMQRPVDTADGPDVAAFTVARLSPGVMPEGRIQMLTHHTEHTVWQPRWLTHPNGATALLDAVIAVGDTAEAAARFSRFLGRPVRDTPAGPAIALDRGRVQITTPDTLRDLIGRVPPSLPFIGAYALVVTSLAVLKGVLTQAGLSFVERDGVVTAAFPEPLGQGAWVFVEDAAALPWRR